MGGGLSVTFERPMQWHREITRMQWRTLFAAQLGWMLDAMDVMLYSFALTTIRAEFHLSSAAAGALARGSAGDLGARRDAVRLALATARPGAFADVVDPGVLGVHGVHGDFAERRESWCSGARWSASGWAGEWAAGSVLVAETWPAAASRQGDRADAIGMGGGLSVWRRCWRRWCCPVGMASVVS